MAENWTALAIRGAGATVLYQTFLYFARIILSGASSESSSGQPKAGTMYPIRTYAADTNAVFANAGKVLRTVDQGLVFDNSGAEPRPVFEMRKGRLLNTADEIPAWVSALMGRDGRRDT